MKRKGRDRVGSGRESEMESEEREWRRKGDIEKIEVRWYGMGVRELPFTRAHTLRPIRRIARQAICSIVEQVGGKNVISPSSSSRPRKKGVRPY